MCQQKKPALNRAGGHLKTNRMYGTYCILHTYISHRQIEEVMQDAMCVHVNFELYRCFSGSVQFSRKDTV